MCMSYEINYKTMIRNRQMQVITIAIRKGMRERNREEREKGMGEER